ncbi:MAG: cysteine peptidase family C39 domain-containing protein [Blastocatellia bacterium]
MFTTSKEKKLKPSFSKQETNYSCVPACLRMVFSSFGLDVPEAELRHVCDSTAFGTGAFQVLDVARRYGFAQTAKHTLTGEELAEVAAADQYPIVFLNLWPLEQIWESHAVIVLVVEDANVLVLDPATGERLIPRTSFEAGWQLQHRVVIIIAK